MTDTIQPYDPSVDLLQAILWQYNDAARLQSLLASKQAWYDQNQAGFWDDWVRDVFDLRTANDFGLSVWSIVLGLPLEVHVPASTAPGPTWGFGSYNQNFGRGNFQPMGGTTVSLTEDQKRFALRLRYFQLANRGAVPEINRFMDYLFGNEGRVYVQDGLNMTMTYAFTFSPPSWVRFILDYYDLLPRPAGVGVSRTVTAHPVWGFGPYNVNFYNSNFVEEF